MQTICTSLQTDNHTNISAINIFNQQCKSTEGRIKLHKSKYYAEKQIDGRMFLKTSEGIYSHGVDGAVNKRGEVKQACNVEK